MDDNFSSRVKDVISFSREEALRLGHDYIGVEHLLLGIIREGDGVAVKIIENSKKVKTYDFPNYEKWRLGITMRVAYGRIGVNAFYSASTIFDDGKGEAINPFSVGITLMPF